MASITSHPRLDPKPVMRVYKKLGISSADELRNYENGELEATRWIYHAN